MSEAMDLTDIAKARIAGDIEALYADLLATLPRCAQGRLAAHVARDDESERYLCGRTACSCADGLDHWEDLPWKWHVVAAQMGRPRGAPPL